MTLVFGMVCAVATRRDAVRAAVAHRFPALQATTAHHVERGDLMLLCEQSAVVPLVSGEYADGAAFVFGRPGLDCASVPAAFTAASSSQQLFDTIAGCDGNFVAVRLSLAGEISVGVDMLGFTPLYVWHTHDMLLFASAPGLLMASGVIATRLDLHGLAASLLLGYMALGRTLWHGVTRPHPGRTVHWSPAHGYREAEGRGVLPSDAYFGLSYKQALDQFSDRLDAAAMPARLPCDTAVGLSLSGGVDSRLLAGVLAARAPDTAQAIILGLPHEDDVRCGAAVARALSMPTTIIPPEMHGDGAAQFTMRADLEQLAHSLWSVSFGSSLDTTNRVPPLFITGTFGDHLAGGYASLDGFDEVRHRHTLAAHVAGMNRWGLSAAEIAQLFGSPALDRAVVECLRAMQDEWDGYPGEEFQRAWLWSTRHRMRFHLAPAAWRQATRRWTYHPYAARPLVELSAGLPHHHTMDRRLQVDLLKQRFPELAALPLDRNSGNLTPLAPSLGYRLGAKARHVIRSRVPVLARRTTDRRTYHRTFDFDGPGWQVVREALDPVRVVGRAMFATDAFDAMLPAPGVRKWRQDSIVEGGKSKVLLTLLCIADRWKLDLSAGALEGAHEGSAPAG